MAATLALLPSPLLGSSVWQPVAEVLSSRGWSTVIGATLKASRTSNDVMAAFVESLPVDRDLVLVPHSNAGAYVPALTTPRSVVGVAFVDAVLPPRRGRVPLAPHALLDFLRPKADADGLLPVWTDWWPEAEVAGLFPDNEIRARVEREQPRLPLSYFEGSLSVPDGWDDRPAAYLAFGDTYGDERDEAERRGWPVATTPGEHLQMLKDPVGVANDLIGLLGDIGIRSSPL